MKNSLKFTFFMVYSIVIFFVENLALLLGLFLCNFLAIAVFKISLGKFMHHLKMLLPFAVFTALLNIIFGDLTLGILMAVRLLIAYQVTYIFSKTMTNLELASVIQNFAYPLRIFKINPEKIGLMVSIAFCVLPILKSEIEQKKYAVRAKGASNIFVMIEPIFISILRRTNEMEKALTAKGYEE